MLADKMMGAAASTTYAANVQTWWFAFARPYPILKSSVVSVAERIQV